MVILRELGGGWTRALPKGAQAGMPVPLVDFAEGNGFGVSGIGVGVVGGRVVCGSEDGVGWLCGGGLGDWWSGGLVEDDGFPDDFGPAVVEGLYEFLSGELLGLEH